ncbi:MAG: hypothetical protein V3V00_15885 [Saprospiraceae bacterium]
MNKEIERLEEIAEIDRTEIGETIQQLLNLYGCRAHLEDEFVKVLENEIKSWYEWSKGFRIVERVETVETRVKVIEDVE